MAESDLSQEQTEKSGITKKESMAILLSSVISAVAVLLSSIFAQKLLPAEDLTVFLVFWSLLFGMYGVISGVASESTRAVGAAHATGKEHSGARTIYIATAVGIILAILLGASSPLWISSFITEDTGITVVLMAIAAVAYSVQSMMIGNSAGTKNWYLMAGINGGEAIWRLAAMIGVGVLANSLWGMEAAVISPAFLWVVIIIFSARGRETFLARADVDLKQLTRNVSLAMGSAAATAVLINGFPAMMKATEHVQEGTHADFVLGALILAVSITRSPIMIPLQAFQGVAISMFLKQKHRPLAAMAKPAGALLGVGALGGLAAYLIGPFLFLEIYEPKPETVAAYQEVAQGWVLGLLTFASAMMALLVLSGTVTLAMNMHRIYILGWVLAAVVVMVLLFLPLPLINRVIIALFVGPLVGFVVHLAGLSYQARR